MFGHLLSGQGILKKISHHYGLLLCLLGVSLLYLWEIRNLPMSNTDDALFGAMVKEVIQGHWYPLRIHGEVCQLSRPPTMIWLGGLLGKIFRTSDAHLIGIVVAFSLATLFMLYLIVMRFNGSRLQACSCLIILASSKNYFFYSLRFFMDVPMIFCTLLTFWYWQREHDKTRVPWGTMTALFLTYLMKGMVVALPLFGFLTYLFLEGRKLKIWQHWMMGWLYVVVPITLWHLIEYLFFFDNVFYHTLGMNLDLIRQPLYIAPQPFTYYFMKLFRVDPLILGMGLAGVVGAIVTRKKWRQAETSVLYGWLVLGMLFISFIGTKLPRYSLALYPVIILLVSAILPNKRWQQAVLGSMALLALLHLAVGRDAVMRNLQNPTDTSLKKIGQTIEASTAQEPIYLYDIYLASMLYYTDKPVVQLVTSPVRYERMMHDQFLRNSGFVIHRTADQITEMIKNGTIRSLLITKQHYLQQTSVKPLKVAMELGPYLFLQP